MRGAPNRSGPAAFALGLVALLVLRRRRRRVSSTPIQVKTQTTPAEQRLAQRDSTDHAALMAASLAAIFAVVAAPGRWDRFAMLLGLTLLCVLFGFFNWKQRLEDYRQEPASRLSRLRGHSGTGFGRAS
jgi:uncharacterized protein (TIGR03382 family)